MDDLPSANVCGGAHSDWKAATLPVKHEQFLSNCAVFCFFLPPLQGCSWSVIFVDLDAHNRNRQTLSSLLPRESRSHVSQSRSPSVSNHSREHRPKQRSWVRLRPSLVSHNLMDMRIISPITVLCFLDQPFSQVLRSMYVEGNVCTVDKNIC